MNLTPSPALNGVPQIEVTTLLLGGSGGPLNEQAQALLDREAYYNATGAVVLSTQPGVVLDGTTDMSGIINAIDKNDLVTHLIFDGVAHIGSPIVITKPIVDTDKQIFSKPSKVTISNGLPVRPEWFGEVAGISAAVDALPTSGGVINLSVKRYGPQGFSYGAGAADGIFIKKDNVTIRGAKMPQLSNDCRSLVGGTIIEGLFLAYANNFSASDLGIDSGINVVTAAGGTPTEGFCITYPSDSYKSMNSVVSSIRVHNIIGLCSDPLAQVHAVLMAEGVRDFSATGEIIGCMSQHGVVIKSQGVSTARIAGYCNGGEGVIVKSDTQATAFSTHVQIGSIITNAAGPFGSSPFKKAITGTGLTFQCTGNNVGSIQIGSAMLLGHPIGLQVLFEADGQQLDCVHIDQILTDQYGVANSIAININSALFTGSQGDGKVKMTFGSATFKNAERGVVASFHNTSALESHVTFGQITADTISDVALDISRESYVTVGNMRALACSGGVYRLKGLPSLDIGTLSKSSSGPTYSNTGGGTVPVLINGWTQPINEEVFSVGLYGGEKALLGAVNTGTSNVIAQLPQWAWPSTPQRVIALGSNGVTEVGVPVTIGIDGRVIVNLATGGTANCSAYISFCGVRYR